MGSFLLTQTLSFLLPIQKDLQQVEQTMQSQAENYHPDVIAALNHLLKSGGKRDRKSVV